MITFKKIRWKNFLSTGQHFTEIDFQKNQTNLIVGTNGAGKSTVLDALTFVLFNRPFRKINKPQLINTTNEKDCLVEIEFSVNARDYLVRRGIKPNVFDIEVNGKQLHKESDDRINQKILEETILKVNYKSFTQIVIWVVVLLFLLCN
jgi:DNA repair exonuclease SbcCD ATPase subunit